MWCRVQGRVLFAKDSFLRSWDDNVGQSGRAVLELDR